MGVHARLSASAAHRWLRCPASIKLSDGIPHTESPYASLGTMAHSVAAFCLKNKLDAADILDEEQAAPVQFYLDICRGIGGKAEIDLTPALAKLDPDMGGTADFVGEDEDERILTVVDFKFGTGVPVAAEDNKQLKMYALGALLAASKPMTTVRTKIVQPRLENPDHWVQSFDFPAFELLEFAADLQEAAVLSRSDDTKPNPGADQCRWCPAAKAGRCPVAVKTSSRKPAGPRATIEDFAVVGGTVNN